MKSVERIVVDSIFLAMTILLVTDSFKYRSDARMFPLVFGVPVGILLVLQLLFDLFPRCRDRLSFLKEQGLFTQSPSAETAPKGANTSKDAWLHILALVAWLSGFVALLRFVDYVYAVPVFALLMIRIQGKETWRRAFCAAAAIGLMVYLLFHLTLKMQYF